MRLLPLCALVLISCAAYVSGDCCYGTTIEYSLPEGVTKCNEQIKEGEHKEHVSSDGVVGDIVAKIDRRHLACWVQVCNDGRSHPGAYCGHGSCLAWGCKCDGGCIGNSTDDPLENFKRLNQGRYKKVLARTGLDAWNPL